ncbi:unnamed protein product [Ectocarpus sp. CCAP 1310/34]|nr:unnamed protein product [Ectocarpus sp. CCAP 1310/34]
MKVSRVSALLPLLLSFFQHTHAWTVPLPLSGGLIAPCQQSFAATPVTPAVTATTTARRSHDGRDTRRQVPTCRLDRLPVRTLKRVVPLRPTPEKYLAHFGQTPLDRRRKMVNFLGGLFAFYWAAFFATRNVYVLGPGGINAIAWRGSCLAVFLQTFLRPVVGSYNRALELWGSGSREERRKTKGALFTGRVTKTGFALSSQASNHRAHFQMLVEDESGRELLFDVPQVPEYRRIRKGMSCAVVVLSRSSGFYELTGVTEAYLPELDLFVGRFPLLDKRVFWDLLHDKNARKRRRGGGTVAANGKQNRLSSSGGGRQLNSSSSSSSSSSGGRSRGGHSRSGGDGGYANDLENSSYRTGQQQQQRHPTRDVTSNSGSSSSNGRDDGGRMVARSPRPRNYQ